MGHLINQIINQPRNTANRKPTFRKTCTEKSYGRKPEWKEVRQRNGWTRYIGEVSKKLIVRRRMIIRNVLRRISRCRYLRNAPVRRIARKRYRSFLNGSTSKGSCFFAATLLVHTSIWVIIIDFRKEYETSVVILTMPFSHAMDGFVMISEPYAPVIPPPGS